MKHHKFDISVVVLGLLLLLMAISGYVTNAAWAFKHMADGFTVETVVALVGLLMVPLGIMHGIYTWF